MTKVKISKEILIINYSKNLYLQYFISKIINLLEYLKSLTLIKFIFKSFLI